MLLVLNAGNDVSNDMEKGDNEVYVEAGGSEYEYEPVSSGELED